MKRLFFLALLFSLNAHATDKPQLWGYGVKPCDAYNRVYLGWEEGREEQIAEYLRFRGWLAGFVSGLNIATGEDVLRGVELEGAMRRIRLHCDEKPGDDFFTAAKSLIRLLSELR